MSFEVGVVAQFTASHHLVGDFGPATEPHSHLYRVEASVQGDRLLPDGTLLDITLLQNALAAAIAVLDRNDLNSVEGLVEPTPTAEVVSRYLFRRVATALDGHRLDSVSIRVWESPEAFASYRGALTTSRS